MGSYDTSSPPWAVDCPWTQGKPRGATMLCGVILPALLARPTLGHLTSFWEWICRSSSPAVGGSFHTVALTRSSSKDNVSPRKFTEVNFDSRLCNCLVWGRTRQVTEGRGEGWSRYTGYTGTERRGGRGQRTQTSGYEDTREWQ